METRQYVVRFFNSALVSSTLANRHSNDNGTALGYSADCSFYIIIADYADFFRCLCRPVFLSVCGNGFDIKMSLSLRGDSFPTATETLPHERCQIGDLVSDARKMIPRDKVDLSLWSKLPPNPAKGFAVLALTFTRAE